MFGDRWLGEQRHRPAVLTGAQAALHYVGIICGITVVGVIDVLLGPNVRVLPLYLIPLAAAGWRLGSAGATTAAVLCSLAWHIALYENGARYEASVWTSNVLSYGFAFLLVSMLVAVLARALRDEQSQSRTDPLTGLDNRKAFVEKAGVALAVCKRYAHPVALAYIDLDNFKQVNDSRGHARGDELLRKCAAIIGRSLRTSDIAARLGGDEFVVFLPETTAESAWVPLERIRQAMESSVDFRMAGVTASIGIVADESGKFDIEGLLKRADAQMYQVKRDSKNRVGARRLAENTSGAADTLTRFFENTVAGKPRRMR